MFELRVVRPQLHHPSRQRPGKRGHSGRQPATPTDAGLVVPDQTPRHRIELAGQQRPHPGQQVRRLPGRDHPPGDEPRERGHHHQHQRRPGLLSPQRHPRRREPQITLDLITTSIHDPVGWIFRRVLDPKPRDLLRNHDCDPGHPTRSASTVAGIVGNSASHCRTCASNASNADGPLTRESAAANSTPPPETRVSRQPQTSRDRPDRQPLTAMQIPDLRPILHCDHPSDPGWVADFKERQWPAFQRASTGPNLRGRFARGSSGVS